MNDNKTALPTNTIEEVTKWITRQLDTEEGAADQLLLELASKANAANEHYLNADLTNMKQMWPLQHKSNDAIRELVAYIASKPTPKDY